MNFIPTQMPNTKYLLLLFVTVLTVATLITRTSGNENNMQWFDDSARDATVAELVVKNGDYTDIRPGVGLLPVLKNSSLYYNYLAGLFWLSEGEKSVFFDLYALLSGISTVIPVFFIGYIIQGFKVAVPAAVTVLIHPLIIFINVSIYQRYLLASLTPLFVLFALLAYKRKNIFCLWVMTIIYLFLISSHYAAVTLAPIFLFIHYKFLKEQKGRVWRISNIIFLIGSSSAFLSTIEIKFNEIGLAGVEPSWKGSYMTPIFQIWDFFNALFSWDFKYLTLMLALFLIVLFLKQKKTDIEKMLFLVLATYFVFQVGVGFSLTTHNLNYKYFYHYMALFIVFFYLVISKININILNIKINIFFLFILFIVFPLSFFADKNLRIDYKKNYYRTKKIADLVSSDFINKNNSKEKYPLVIDNTPWAPAGWFASSINHHIVKSADEYYSLRKGGNNLKYEHKNYGSFYLVCRMWLDEDDSYIDRSRASIIREKCVNDMFNEKINGLDSDNIDVRTVYNEERNYHDSFVVLYVDTNGQEIDKNFLLNPWPQPVEEPF